ncbi:hypothetical protein M885DRAFT_574612 [Pelagophyceae sp. CCMP2097]|nr:hypothetical protein M885DRAFT_574612 [Pelagophyceae sp. CCMP2097]
MLDGVSNCWSRINSPSSSSTSSSASYSGFALWNATIVSFAARDLGAADFAETLEKLAAEVESFECHIIQWGHETARHEKMVEILTVDRRVLVVNPVIGSIRVEYFEPGEAKAIVDTGFIDLVIKAEVSTQLPAPPEGRELVALGREVAVAVAELGGALLQSDLVARGGVVLHLLQDAGVELVLRLLLCRRK